MRAGSLRSWYGFGLLSVLGACSNIIGVSGIEIDPSLDGGGNGGKSAAGGKSSGGNSVSPSAGDEAGGSETGGKAAGGSEIGGSETGGSAAVAGAGGEPEAPAGCGECDDQIDCTKDTCGCDGKCVHTADDTACTPASGMCSHCEVGIGCVDSTPQVTELLLDPNFDQNTGDWSEYSQTFDDKNIFADAEAQSGGYAVHFGPAAPTAKEREFSDLNQQFTVPAGTIKLTVSGYYKLLPGANVEKRPIADDYTTLTLFSLEQPKDATHDDTWYIRYVDYHSFDGDDPKQATWTAFSYETPKAVLSKVAGQDVTLDLVCETWDTLYYFDSLSLKATACE